SVEVGPVKVLTMKAEGDANALRKQGDILRDKEPKIVALLAAVNGEKLSFLCVCGKDAVAAGVKAGDLIRKVSAVADGKGGGRPDSAMGGGTNVAKLDEAINSFLPFVKEAIG
ncbi:MAG: alanine--tRNA ligase, partial [Oscillospiraceae bacterium]|nr:alanine--tRNA ligase [Oscillospiraceae bacterium]